MYIERKNVMVRVVEREKGVLKGKWVAEEGVVPE